VNIQLIQIYRNQGISWEEISEKIGVSVDEIQKHIETNYDTITSYSFIKKR
jgi:biotin operon repressor